MPPIFLIVGAPAAGKSTAARALAATFPKSIVICVDDLRSMVVSGLLHPGPQWSDALAEQLQLARAGATAIARTYHAAGYAVMIDDFWDPQTQMGEYSALIATNGLTRVLLYPNREKAHAQNLRRSGDGGLRDYLDEGIAIVYDALDGVTPALVRDGWAVLDTTDDSVADTVARLRALLA